MGNEKLKARFVEALVKACGIIAKACITVGIGRSTYYRWMAEDAVFKASVDEVMDTQVDFVEDNLLRLIREGDTSATIFYLKTKGKRRGYSDKAQPMAAPPAAEAARAVQPEHVERRVKSKKKYIVKLLKDQGKYTAELTYQVDITAKLLVRAEMIEAEIMAEGHRAVNVEYSREGNERVTVNPKERLYLDLLERGQRALRALGMNTESKERHSDADGFSDFMDRMQEGRE